MPRKSEPDCDCLKHLDELRLRLEEGKVDGFEIVVDDKEGTWVWGHKPDYVHAALQLLKTALGDRSKK